MKNHLSWVFRRQASASGQDPTSTSGDKTNGGLVGQKESDEKKRRGRRKVRSREPSMKRDFDVLIAKVLEKSVSMMESFQGGEEVNIA